MVPLFTQVGKGPGPMARRGKVSAFPDTFETSSGGPDMVRPRWQFDLVASGWLAAGLVAALCVFSHDPADPPHPTLFPANESASNLLGDPGAWLADLLLGALGAAAYPFLAACFVLVLMLYLRRRWWRWGRRLAGWLMLAPCAAVFADLYVEQMTGPAVGGGGALGAWLSGLAGSALGVVGRAALLVTASAAGVSLAADFLLLRGVYRLVRGSASEGRRGPDAPPAPPPPARESAAAAGVPVRRPAAERGPAEPAPAKAPVVYPPIIRPAPVPMEQERFDDYELPPLTLLEDPQPFPYEEHDQRLRERAVLLEKTFADFGLKVRVVGINTGPVITQYEVALETGLRVNKVTRLADDLALNLKVPSVRVVAPIPGKNTVGIEIPNEHRAVVRLKEVILTAGKKVGQLKIPLFLGKDTEGRPLVYDLAEMPHLLIAGRTGTGKSVCMNAIILSMLMTRRPDEVKMVMIDPKMLELSEYAKIPHLMHPVVKDMKKAEAILAWAVDKMEERYDLLSRARVRGIAGYNELSLEEIHRRVKPDEEERARIPERMPYVVIFVDEMGDLMMQMKKEVEGHIVRLAQKSRAAGIHLVVATQKPTVDVITGLIKSNLPARICFQVSSRSDSRVVLDEMGADKLLGKGDMLFLQPGTSTLMRAQGTYLSDGEIQKVVEHLECEPNFAQELVQIGSGSGEGKGGLMETLRARDELYEQAIEVIVREGRGSVSLLQRALGIGYGRAARLIDFMAEDGIVGGYNGSSAREVLYTPEEWDQLKQGSQPAA
jgi:S-DNA-T family DNA segregation ATPase FtsK/SpoIIIE